MATTSLPGALVDADWLAARRAAPDLAVLDASWHLPTTGRDPRAEFAAEHIPGARFFDIDAIADPETELPHMLPSAADFAAAVGALGIGNATSVVVYDTLGLFSAARAWWMFRVFGHEAVAVLDGGLPEWRHRGLALASGDAAPAVAARFDAALVRERVRTLDDVLATVGDGRTRLLDARPPGRFRGEVPEPRPGVRPGHIPGAANIPYDRVIDPDSGRMRDRAELAGLFAGAGRGPIVCSCGTGVTACMLALALELAGHPDVAVYDGSWAEWGRRTDTPVETGPGPGPASRS